MRRASVFMLVLGVLFVSACGSDGDDSDNAASTSRPSSSTTSTTSSTPSTATPATTSAPSPTVPACPPLDGGTTGLTEHATTSATALLRDVQLTTGDCTDSVAFTFDAAGPDAPGYRIEYVSGPITQDASGEPVTVAGGAYLSVRFEPAYGYDFETGEDTYPGPGRVSSPGAFFVHEVVQTGDFEAVLNWVIGVDQQRPYVVTTTGTTTRTVTIDIR